MTATLFGLSHGIIDQAQYSALVAAVIASAVIPTIIANSFFLPHHLLPDSESESKPQEEAGAIPLRRVLAKAE
jgi:glutathione-regulated potassium-efflux system ancillary protein KefC